MCVYHSGGPGTLVRKHFAHRDRQGEFLTDRKGVVQPRRSDIRVLFEAQMFNVVPYLPGGYGEIPNFEQWWAVSTDLAAMPVAVTLNMQKYHVPLVMLYDRPCTDHPAYLYAQGVQVDGSVEGATYSTALGICGDFPIFRVNRAFPWLPDGLAHAGTSVHVHEIGHWISKSPNWGQGTLVENRREFADVHSKSRWWSPLLTRNRSEAFAESFAVWVVKRSPEGVYRLPPDIDPTILGFWDKFALSLGWT